MAFALSGFVRLGTANTDGGTLWMYKEAETLANMRAANYFNDAVANNGLSDEDVIMLFGSDGFGFSSISVSGENATVNEDITSS